MFERYRTKKPHPYGFAERSAHAGQVAAGQGRLDDGIECARQATELLSATKDIRSYIFETYLIFLPQAARPDKKLL